MPTYEYACTHCNHTFSVFQSMTEAPLKRCPECRHKIERLIGTGSGIIFKGSGFYETDYKRKKTDACFSGPNSASQSAKSDSPAPVSESKPKQSETSKSGN